MPTLNSQGVIIDDHWFVPSDDSEDGRSGALVPAERWRADDHPGLALAGDSEPIDAHSQAKLIAIDFPVFTDGRGLSLATLLRERFNFEGELRALGDVHPDMLHYLVRCGFDSFTLPPHRDLSVAQASLQPFAGYYQRSIRNPTARHSLT